MGLSRLAPLLIGAVLFCGTAWAADDPGCTASHDPSLKGIAVSKNHDKPDLIIFPGDATLPKASLSLDACVAYAPDSTDDHAPYYTGTITNVFFDRDGHYLGSNGQELLNANRAPLQVGAWHDFGAGVGLEYRLTGAAAVASRVLIEAAIRECAGPAPETCSSDAPVNHLLVYQSVDSRGASVADANPDSGYRGCANPEPKSADTTGHGQQDQDAYNENVRLFAEGLFLAADSSGVRTNLTILGCLRFIPIKSADAAAPYLAQAQAYFFDTSGNLVGAGALSPSVGGQQLGVIITPKPFIANNSQPALVRGDAGVHDFGVEISIPSHSFATIDSHVLIATTLWGCRSGGALHCQPENPQTLYRIVETCAPNLPGFNRQRCPGIAAQQ